LGAVVNRDPSRASTTGLSDALSFAVHQPKRGDTREGDARHRAHRRYRCRAMSTTPAASSAHDIAFLRHTLATLAYRAEKVLREPPSGFATQRIGAHSRTPLQLVGHLGDLLEWAVELADGKWAWRAASVGDWNADVARFYSALAKLDARLATGAPLGHPAQQIFQAPIADALTHVGQLALLRGHFGATVRPESYGRAEIVAGRVGRDQALTRREFDGDASAKR
jgi:hypothetical protein